MMRATSVLPLLWALLASPSCAYPEAQQEVDVKCSPDDSENNVLLQVTQGKAQSESKQDDKVSKHAQRQNPPKRQSPYYTPENKTFDYVGCCLIVGILGLLPVIRFWADKPETRSTKVSIITSFLYYIWLIGGILMLMRSIKFNSAHTPDHPDRHLYLPEAVYLMIQIVTTVGFGDITPADSYGRTFLSVYILVSILVVADMIMSMAGNLVDKINRMEMSAAAAMMHANLTETHTEKWYLKKKPKLHAAKFLAALGACLFAFLAGTVFHHGTYKPELSWSDSFYMCTVTASTIGFGDFTEDGDFKQVVGTVWMLFGVAAFANFVVRFSALLARVQDREVYHAEEAEAVQLARLKQLYENMNEEKIDKNAFLRLSLQQLGMVSAEDVAMIDSVFQTLGPDKSGRLGYDKLVRQGSAQKVK